MPTTGLDRRGTRITKHNRVRSGCLICRQRRKKCDEQKPNCQKCERMGLECEWPQGFTFRVSGPGIEKRARKSSASSAKRPPSPPQVTGSNDSSSASAPGLISPQEENMGGSQLQRQTTADSTQMIGGNAPESVHDEQAAEPERSLTGEHSLQNEGSLHTTLGDFSALEGSTTDWLPNALNDWTWSPLDPILSQSPDAFTMYYPNAEYRALHTTLYNYMVDTAKAGNSGHATPDSLVPNSTYMTGSSDTAGQLSASALPSSTVLSPQREQQLWANYLEEITDWLDMFDNSNHFKTSISSMAQDSKHLRLAILALSSRQLERKDPNKPYVESLGLYGEAIQLINHDLASMSTAVIASCVLLCVLEMMSSSPAEWARHLDGCAMLLTAAGIHGAVGGTRQAIFWCFARMDLWRGFLTDSNTKIPTSLWYFPGESMSHSMGRLEQDKRAFDQYANFSTFLCASVLQTISTSQETGFAQRWADLFQILERWYDNRPMEMRPVFTSFDKEQHTFPILVFSNPPAISGNQMFHSASLLMLQARPKHIKSKGSKSIFWHARHIVGISACNRNHGAWTNAPQSLWIAGRVMSHPDEHRIVLELLQDIERETGFATAWRAEDLKTHWGDFDSS